MIKILLRISLPLTRTKYFSLFFHVLRYCRHFALHLTTHLFLIKTDSKKKNRVHEKEMQMQNTEMRGRFSGFGGTRLDKSIREVYTENLFWLRGRNST